jgi:predicted secreted protein
MSRYKACPKSSCEHFDSRWVYNCKAFGKSVIPADCPRVETLTIPRLPMTHEEGELKEFSDKIDFIYKIMVEQLPRDPKLLDYVIRKKGEDCPYCGWWDTTGDSVDIENGKVLQRKSCGNCNMKWTDVYTLTGVEE